MAESLIFGNQRIGARRGRARLRSRPRGCKLADVFTALALLLIAFIAFATGFEPQFNGPFAIAAVVLLFLGAITDSLRRRFRRR
jgi:uncharacterized membrane protein YoaK (UPF0700 family)